MTETRAARSRNRAGEGGRLRDDILEAASRLLTRTGSEDDLTLRAIAREAGITAPAIYAHYDDRDQIRYAVVQRTFAELAATLAAAAETSDDPVRRLRAVCHAYLDFAGEQPHHYRLLFERHRRTQPAAHDVAEDVQSIVGADAFGVLLDAVAGCIASGASTGSEATAVTTRVWVGLHGQATLQASLPWFPWPERDELADAMLTRLADLTGTPPRGA